MLAGSRKSQCDPASNSTRAAGHHADRARSLSHAIKHSAQYVSQGLSATRSIPGHSLSITCRAAGWITARHTGPALAHFH
jgi:hypothetical protein